MRRPVRRFKDVLWAFALIGALAIVFRLVYGLGATTNLNDALPWGLWKILNMVAGVALATGGFTIGLLVYVLGIERLRPLVKPAILIAFLGYGSSVFALMLDIGLPHRIWHPFLMWNPHSFLFEVAMCVAFYFTTTIVEMSPTIAERFPRWQRLAHRLHRATPVVVIVGITLSSLHHTSLGSLFLVTPTRLHPLWYTGWLPVLFINSAMGAGMMVVVLVWMLWSRLYDPAPVFGEQRHRWEPIVHGPPETDQRPEPADLPMLRLLASIAAGVLAVYLVLKLVDLARTGAWRELLAGSWESWLYVLELGLTAVVPVALMAIPAVRRHAAGIAAAASSAGIGMTLNRLSVGIFGYFRDALEIYLPSAIEWAVCLGVIAAAGIVLLFVGENFAVFRTGRRPSPAEELASSLSARRRGGIPGELGSRVERVLLLSVFVVPVAWIGLYPPFHTESATATVQVEPPRSTDPARAVFLLDGNERGLRVKVPHSDHRKRAEEDDTCGRCHHMTLPRDHATRCTRCHRHVWVETCLFDHDEHHEQVAHREELAGAHPENASCAFCHPRGRAHGAATVKGCAECHDEDMHSSRQPDRPLEWEAACGYLPAVHKTCLPCHEEQAVERARPELAECTHCHPAKPAEQKLPSLMRAAARSSGPRRTR
jgi:Ni/Fe-hydrogenase subunit HybB-like protein